MTQQFEPGLGFAFLTPLYDTFTNLVGFKGLVKRALQVLKATGVRGDEKVMDLGCGTGTLAVELKRQFPAMAITGMDPDTKMLELAQRKFRKNGMLVELKHGFAQELPFADASFDVVTSTLVFHHLPTGVKIEAVREVRRVLRPSGLFLLADFGKPETVAGKVLLGMVGMFEKLSDNVRGRLPVMLTDAGFRVEEKRPGYRGVQFLVARPGETPLIHHQTR